MNPPIKDLSDILFKRIGFDLRIFLFFSWFLQEEEEYLPQDVYSELDQYDLMLNATYPDLFFDENLSEEEEEEEIVESPTHPPSTKIVTRPIIKKTLPPCVKNFSFQTSPNDVRFPAFFGFTKLNELGYLGHFFPVMKETPEEVIKESKLVFFITQVEIKNGRFRLQQQYKQEFLHFVDFYNLWKDTPMKKIPFVIIIVPEGDSDFHVIPPRETVVLETFISLSKIVDVPLSFRFFRYNIDKLKWKVEENRERRKTFFKFIQEIYPNYIPEYSDALEYQDYSPLNIQFPIFAEISKDDEDFTAKYNLITIIRNNIAGFTHLKYKSKAVNLPNPDKFLSAVVLMSDIRFKNGLPNVQYKKGTPWFFLIVEKLRGIEDYLQNIVRLIDYFGADVPYIALVAIPVENIEECQVFINHVPIRILFIGLRLIEGRYEASEKTSIGALKELTKIVGDYVEKEIIKEK